MSLAVAILCFRRYAMRNGSSLIDFCFLTISSFCMVLVCWLVEWSVLQCFVCDV